METVRESNAETTASVVRASEHKRLITGAILGTVGGNGEVRDVGWSWLFGGAGKYMTDVVMLMVMVVLCYFLFGEARKRESWFSVGSKDELQQQQQQKRKKKGEERQLSREGGSSIVLYSFINVLTEHFC